MIVRTESKQFMKQMNNIVDYSFGFLDGIKRGKHMFLTNLGAGVIHAIGQYVDVMAKSDPKALHHVYEWTNIGSPSARLFDLKYSVTGLGLSIGSTFKQSRTVSENMTQPFYNKAKIMEEGTSVRIVPQKNNPLRFYDNGSEVFTKQPVTVNNPGGDAVKGAFEKTVEDFVRLYLKQSFLRASGLFHYLENPVVYKNNIRAGSKMGKSKGVQVGIMWITKATIGVE